jgi:hypothetical protein
MKVINARNVHQALPEALYQLRADHVRRESRNGPVLVAPCPVTTLYRLPMERVIFWPQRDANPFFHLFESFHMLAGRNDVAYLEQFNANIKQYSDDGKIFNGAYGFRWRFHFEQPFSIDDPPWDRLDQLHQIAGALRDDPSDRRQVLAMWDPETDLGSGSKDIPCNTHAYLSRNARGELDMTVCNRSNDVVWGCYGANAVHFSILQEYVAAMIGCPVGRYWQMSNNWHLYEQVHGELLAEMSQLAPNPPSTSRCPYSAGQVEPMRLVADVDAFDQDLRMFLQEGEKVLGYREPFIRRVAVPMLRAWKVFKEDTSPSGTNRAMQLLEIGLSNDWLLASYQWMERRHLTRLKKEQNRADADAS